MIAVTRGEKAALWWTQSSLIWALAIFLVIMFGSTPQPSISSFRNPAGPIFWASGALVVVGVGGVAVWRQRKRLGAFLCFMYSLLWATVLAYSLAWIWGAGADWSVCLSGVNVCITGWWARCILAGGLVPFVVAAGWFWSRLASGALERVSR